MKKYLISVFVAASLGLTGCGVLLPKKVEFFQDKVKPVPELKASEKETMRQAAKLASQKASQTLVAAVAENASPNVLLPASDAVSLTESVSTSVGPPLNPSTLTAEELAVKLNTAVAKLNSRIDDFKQDNNENVGKKIEGTGLFQIGYFSMWLVILGGLAVVWVGLKIYGSINPLVGIGVNSVGRVSSGLLKKGLTELTEGGEWFKEYVSEAKQEVFSRPEVLELFRRAHSEAQSRDTQDLIEGITKK